MKTQVILIIRGGETYDSYEEYLDGLKAMTIDLNRLINKGWKDSLQERLGPDFQVILPGMPNTLNAKYSEWKIYFDKLLPLLNEEVILVGNSLGSIFLVKYFAENTVSKKIPGLFLVGAPFDDKDRGESLADFILPDDLSRLKKQCRNIRFYFSKDDPVIPITDMEKYKRTLPEANYILLDGRGHFNVPEFPEIVDDIIRMQVNI